MLVAMVSPTTVVTHVTTSCPARVRFCSVVTGHFSGLSDKAATYRSCLVLHQEGFLAWELLSSVVYPHVGC